MYNDEHLHHGALKRGDPVVHMVERHALYYKSSLRHESENLCVNIGETSHNMAGIKLLLSWQA